MTCMLWYAVTFACLGFASVLGCLSDIPGGRVPSPTFPLVWPRCIRCIASTGGVRSSFDRMPVRPPRMHPTHRPRARGRFHRRRSTRQRPSRPHALQATVLLLFHSVPRPIASVLRTGLFLSPPMLRRRTWWRSHVVWMRHRTRDHVRWRRIDASMESHPSSLSPGSIRVRWEIASQSTERRVPFETENEPEEP